jgi:arylsulfatase A-like enzyme
MELPDSEEPLPPESLGSAWIGPGLLLAGILALGRVKILEKLASGTGDGPSEWFRWALLADWPAEMVKGLMMGSAAAAVIWSARGGRRPFGILLGGLILLSALTGWPIAATEEIPRGTTPGVPGPLELGLVCLALASSLSLLAWTSSRTPVLARLLSSPITLGLLGSLGLGLPGWLLWSQANQAPPMPVREILAELDTESASWSVVREDPLHPARAAILSPFTDMRFTRAVHDTGDKVSLVMSPPCEVSFTIPEGSEGAQLLLAAQIDGRYTDRGIDDPELPYLRKDSILDGRGLDSLSVSFEVERDGESIYSSTITHRHDETGAEREWQHLGSEGAIEVAPGQVVTLRTNFGDPATALAFAEEGLDCGFGGLVLERWEERPRQRSNPSTPNILFITVDTLRADRMSCYGYEKYTTPHMDRLAERGILFRQAFSTSSWTWPSTASLLTGLLPYEHGVLSNKACNLNYNYETLAEALQQRGYTTSAISCNPLIDQTRQFDQGFERFDAGPRMRMTDEVIDLIEAEIRALASTRFFLYLQLADPHTPHRPLPSELDRLGGEEPEDFPDRIQAGIEVDGMDHYAGRLMADEACDEFGVQHPERVVPPEHAQWISDRYDASVGTGDHYIGRILELLDSLELTEKTIVVITSDHGEEIFDHGMLAHGHALWSELVHVPLIIAGPGLANGQVIHEEVSNRHLAPTLAIVGGGELAGVTDALNLLAQEFSSPTVFYQTSKGYWNGHKGLEVQGLRQDEYSTHFAEHGGRWKREPEERGEARIFATGADFKESTDLFIDSKFRAIAARSAAAIQASVREQRERRQGSDIGIGGSGLKALKDLGYVGGDESLEDARGDGADPEKEEQPR